jgi:hypothetical protein
MGAYIFDSSQYREGKYTCQTSPGKNQKLPQGIDTQGINLQDP